MRFGFALAVSISISSAALTAPYDDELAALTRGLPSDVHNFIDRRANCNHWLGEEAYDAERKAEILSALAELRCEAAVLARDEATLKRRYANDAGVLRALETSRDWSPG